MSTSEYVYYKRSMEYTKNTIDELVSMLGSKTNLTNSRYATCIDMAIKNLMELKEATR